jgi:hypothetical protein
MISATAKINKVNELLFPNQDISTTSKHVSYLIWVYVLFSATCKQKPSTKIRFNLLEYRVNKLSRSQLAEICNPDTRRITAVNLPVHLGLNTNSSGVCIHAPSDIRIATPNIIHILAYKRYSETIYALALKASFRGYTQ